MIKFSQLLLIAYISTSIIAFKSHLHTKYKLNNNLSDGKMFHKNTNISIKSISDMMRECAINDASIPDAAHLLPGIETEILKARIKRAKQAKGLIKLPKHSITGSIDLPTNYAQEICKLVEHYNEHMLNNAENMEVYEPRGLRDVNWWEEEKVFEVFPVLLDEGAPISPGQIAKVTLDERHRSKLIEAIRFNQIIGICIAFIRNDNPEDPNSVPELVEYGSISELLDISNLDAAGEIIIRPIERFRIIKFDATPGDTHMRATVKLIKDEHIPLRNLTVTLENVKALYSLYDKCNFLQEEYCKLTDRVEQMKSIAEREDFHSKVDGMISHIEFDPDDPNLLAQKEISPTRRRIFEIISFCAMEFHCDENTRIWGSKITDTEERLIAVRLILEKKMIALKTAIERLINERKNCVT